MISPREYFLDKPTASITHYLKHCEYKNASSLGFDLVEYYYSCIRQNIGGTGFQPWFLNLSAEEVKSILLLITLAR
jgi:hypothetical protein